LEDPADLLPFGFVTIATGAPHFFEMAVDLALSIRQFHQDPVFLMTDVAGRDFVQGRYAGAFDRIVVLPEGVNSGFLSKCALGDHAPLAHAVFIDADCIVVAPLDRLRAYAFNDGLTMIGELRQAHELSRFHGANIGFLCKHFKTDQFFKNHAGAFCYTRRTAQKVMHDAVRVYAELEQLDPLMIPFANDELAFGIVGGRHQIHAMPSPSPIHWTADLVNMRAGEWPKPIAHFHNIMPKPILRALLQETGRRRRAYGFDEQPTHLVWRKKLRRNRGKTPFGLMRCGLQVIGKLVKRG
jgi:hypothetical protein